MKIEGTILKEFDVCWKKVDWVKTWNCCGHTVRIECLMDEDHICAVCGGNFHELFPRG